MTGTVTKAWDVTWEGGVGVGLGTFSDPGVGTRAVAQGLKKATLGTTSCPESRFPRTAPE